MNSKERLSLDSLSETATRVCVPAAGGLGVVPGTVPVGTGVALALADGVDAGLDAGVGAAAAVDGLRRRSTGLSESSDCGSGADCGGGVGGVDAAGGVEADGVAEGTGVACGLWLSSGRCNRGRSSLELPPEPPPDGVDDPSGVGDDAGDDDLPELSPGRFRRGRPSLGLSAGAGVGAAFLATAVYTCHLPSAVHMLPLEEFVIVT